MPCGTKSRGGPTTIRDWIYTETIHSPYYSQTTNVAATNVETAGDWERTSGECIPNYHKRLAKGELLPHTPFSQYQNTWKADGVHDIRYDDGTWVVDKEWNFYYLWNESPQETERNEVFKTIDHEGFIQAAYADAYGKFDVLTFVAELNKTIKMFKNILQHIVKLLKKRPKDIANDYLELRYGWRVLMYEIKSFIEAMQALDRKYELVTGRAGNSRTYQTSKTVHKDSYDFELDVEVVDYVEIGERGTCTLQAYLNSPFIFNPFVTGWELVKYSFVIDWVINIGQSLKAMSAAFLSSNSAASSGYLIKWQRTAGYKNIVMKPYRTGTLSMEYTWDASWTFRHPGSVSFTPQVEVDLNWFQIADLIALIVQLYNNWRK